VLAYFVFVSGRATRQECVGSVTEGSLVVELVEQERLGIGFFRSGRNSGVNEIIHSFYPGRSISLARINTKATTLQREYPDRSVMTSPTESYVDSASDDAD